MKRLLKIQILLFIIIFSGNSQPIFDWEKNYSVSNGRTGVESFSLDSAGNIITAGFFYGNTIGTGILVAKYFPDGSLMWSREEFIAFSSGYIKTAIDQNGNIFVGTSDYEDWIMYKFDANGVKLWENRFNYWIYGNNNLKAMTMDTEGNVYATGYMQDSSWLTPGYFDYNLCLIKYTPEGNIQWVKYYDDGDNAEVGNDICIGTNGDIAVCGRTFVNGDPSSIFLTLLYNSDGQLKWAKKFGTENSLLDVTYNVKMDRYNNIVVAGVVDTQFCTVKYSNNGLLRWSRFYNGRSLEAQDIKLNLDTYNNVIVSAPVWSYEGIFLRYSVTTVKYSPGGYRLWEQTLRRPGWDASPKAMMLDGSNDIYVCGYSGEDIYDGKGKVLLCKYNKNGFLMWEKLYGNDTYGFGTGAGILDRNNNIYIGGSKRHIDSTDLTDDLFILKYDQPGLTETALQFTLLQNYPNPFNPVTNIKFFVPQSGNVKLNIFDILGRKISTIVDKHFEQGEYAIEFDGNKLASGVYFYSAEYGSFTETKKMILVK